MHLDKVSKSIWEVANLGCNPHYLLPLKGSESRWGEEKRLIKLVLLFSLMT